MSNRGVETDGSGTATSSTDSGLGSGSLSDAFVAVEVTKSTVGSKRRVQAPAGSASLEVRRSSRVASRLTRTTASVTSDRVSGEASPGSAHATGYNFRILQPVAEERLPAPGHPRLPTDPLGNAVGFRDTVTPQRIPEASEATLPVVGRKRAATSAAPGSVRRGQGPSKLASADDFPPGHFDEPFSDDYIPVLNSPHGVADQASPMKLDPANREISAPRDTAVTPISSALSINPLLQRPAGVSQHTPSPGRRQPASLRTRDGNAAWAAAEGLLPVGEGFQAPGYVPVGGVLYTVRSPRAQIPASHGSKRGRQLFAEYASMAETGPHDLAQHGTQPGQQGQMAMQSNAQGVVCNSPVLPHILALTRI
jgi:hypothetical protein